MKVLNVHTRIIQQPKNKVVKLLETLATKNDKIWPKEHWPAMKFKSDLKIGASGGHGPICYEIEIYNPEKIIQFRFLKPKGFNGIHKFEVTQLAYKRTEIKHTIDMITNGSGIFLWLFTIRSLHNALVEDAFDKIENSFSNQQKFTEWNIWVKFLRKSMR